MLIRIAIVMIFTFWQLAESRAGDIIVLRDADGDGGRLVWRISYQGRRSIAPGSSS